MADPMVYRPDSAIAPERRRNTIHYSENCLRIAQVEPTRKRNPDCQSGYKFILKPGDYDVLLASQAGRCAICWH